MTKPPDKPPSRQWPPLLVVGLTGGIASGKSTVAGMLSAYGATVLDADALGREVVAPGQPALAELAEAFGADVIQADGALARRLVADRVFGSPERLHSLNRITHPRIESRLTKKLRSLSASPPSPPIIVVEAAILVEAGWFRLMDRIIVVVAQHSTQTSRLMAEHGLTEARATARIQAQLPAQDRVRYADFQVDGQTPLAHTQQQVALIWEELVRLL